MTQAQQLPPPATPTEAPGCVDTSVLGASSPAAVADRIRQAIEASGVDGKQFASAVGIPYSTMRTYMSGPRLPSAEFTVGALKAFGLSPAWLLSGVGPMKLAADSGGCGPGAGDTVLIERLAVTASAGPGCIGDGQPSYRVGVLSVTRDWLAQRRLSPTHIRAISVRGNSMEPLLYDGDLVLVDTSDHTPRSGFMYVLRNADELLVKYCELLPGGLLRISSANIAFQPYDVDLSRTPDVSIVGRVVASLHDW